MALSNVKVPLYNCSGVEKNKELTIDEFAGRIILTIKDIKKNTEIEVECYWEDLVRAWEAVKRF